MAIQQGLAAWQEALELRSSQEELLRTLRASGLELEDEETARLSGEIEAAQRAVERCQEVEQARAWLRSTLMEQTTLYTRSVLKPADDVLGRFLAALVHDRRFELQYHTATTARGTDLHHVLDWRGANSERQRPAEVILSEGQLSAVSVAQLLTMSTVYRWSTWRALLLDAPTQHNDLIHTTSLIDVLRNIVVSEDYQLILSTHDQDEAAFFRRKLRAGGIPVTECSYLGNGPNGVECRITAW